MFVWIFLVGWKKEATKPRENTQNSKVLQFDMPLRLNEWKPAVCNLAVSVLQGSNDFRNVALASEV